LPQGPTQAATGAVHVFEPGLQSADWHCPESVQAAPPARLAVQTLVPPSQ